MTRTGKVIWSEGMHLGPQHFQMQSRYFETLLRCWLEAFETAPYGIFEIEMDDAAIADGKLGLRRISGIWPDTAPFLAPEAGALPIPLDLDEFLRPGEPGAVVWLATSARRYSKSETLVPDLLTGDSEQWVATASQDLSWRRGTEMEGRTGFPAFRVQRKPGGGFTIDESFHGPCMRVAAAPGLVRALGSLIELMEDKARTAPHPRDLTPGASGFSARGIGQAWFLHTINSSLASLRRIRQGASVHPERLYRELARLGGALCTFSLETHPSSLPLYDHGDQAAVFARLFSHIRAHLHLVAPSNSAQAPLRPAAKYFYDGDVMDSRWVNRSRWYLAMRSPIGDAALIDAAPRLVKVCSREFVPKLVDRALPGLTLRHVSAPPPAISPRMDRQYFEIEQVGPCWEHLVKTGKFGIYVPGEFGAVEIEVMILLDQPE